MALFVLSDEELAMPGESPTLFGEDYRLDEERNPLKELFPNLNLCLSPIHSLYSATFEPLFNFELELSSNGVDIGSSTLTDNVQIDNPEVPKPEPKKRGRPRKNKVKNKIDVVTAAAEPIIRKKSVPSVELSIMERKKKKRKCMSQVEKAQHNHLERERRKGMTALLETLRTLVPSVKDDMKASQKKIVDEAAAYLKTEKPSFHSFLKERELNIRLLNRKRQLENELAKKRGILCVWEERRGMSASDLYNKVKTEAKEDLRDYETEEAIRLLESYCYRSPAGSPSSESSVDSDDEPLNVEV